MVKVINNTFRAVITITTTNDGTVAHFTIYEDNPRKLLDILKKFTTLDIPSGHGTHITVNIFKFQIVLDDSTFDITEVPYEYESITDLERDSIL